MVRNPIEIVTNCIPISYRIKTFFVILINFDKIPEDPVFGTPDKGHFFIFMFIRGTMYISVIFFEIFVPIKLTFMIGTKSCFRLLYPLFLDYLTRD